MKIKSKFANKSSIVILGILILLIIAGVLFVNSPTKMPSATKPSDPTVIFPMDTGVFGEVTPHSSDDGIAIIGKALELQPQTLTHSLETIWESEQYTGTFTPVEKAELKNGSLGVLTIDAIGLSTNVYESTDDMSTLGKQAAHFPSTSAWDGNVGVSAHNVNLDGTAGLFLNLHKLQKGDAVSYKTALGERQYQITTILEISQDDWSYLGYSDENKITLITCITGRPEQRLMVQATEVK